MVNNINSRSMLRLVFNRQDALVVLPFFVSIFVFVCTVFYLALVFNFSFTNLEFVMLSVIDYFVTITALFYIVFKFRKAIQQKILFFIKVYQPVICDLINYIALFTIPMAYYSLKNLLLVLYEGFGRNELVFEVGANRYMSFFMILFYCLFPISLCFRFPMTVRFITFAGFSAGVLFQLSRSAILFSLLYGFLLITFQKFNSKRLVFLVLIVFVVFILTSAMTFTLQERSSSFYGSMEQLIDRLFKYDALSFGLAEVVIREFDSIDYLLFPLFGYLPDRFIFSPLGLQLNKKFSVVEFVNIANDTKANVLYPWWSWFYSQYGAIGLFFKLALFFSFWIFLVKRNLFFTFFYALQRSLFVIHWRHPMLSSADLYNVVSLICFDLIIILYFYVHKEHYIKANMLRFN